MCHWFSFVVVSDDGRCLTGDGNSHLGIEKGWGLAPGGYREAEWLGEDPDQLKIRSIDKMDLSWHRAVVLCKYFCRSELLAAITEGRTANARYRLRHGLIHCDDGPAIVSSDGTKEYWVEHRRHRIDGPAVLGPGPVKQYWVEGKLHRIGGPAVEGRYGHKEYWENGKRIK